MGYSKILVDLDNEIVSVSPTEDAKYSELSDREKWAYLSGRRCQIKKNLKLIERVISIIAVTIIIYTLVKSFIK